MPTEVRLERPSRLPGYCVVVWRHGHLHTHVLPRYVDGPEPGGPITWADVFNGEPTLLATVRQQARRLADRLAS